METPELIPDFCDMCGRDLEGFPLDYRVTIEVASGRTRGDLADYAGDDPRAEMRRLIEAAMNRTGPELMDGIYRKMVFTICPECQKKYIQEPIPRNFKGSRK